MLWRGKWRGAAGHFCCRGYANLSEHLDFCFGVASGVAQRSAVFYFSNFSNFLISNNAVAGLAGFLQDFVDFAMSSLNLLWFSYMILMILQCQA